jgi:hypothetical protein
MIGWVAATQPQFVWSDCLHWLRNSGLIEGHS